jgi:hypothetical protein
MREETLNRQVERQVESLQREFAEIPSDRVTALAESELDRLRAEARIVEFVPVLMHRYAREELLRIRRDELRLVA